MLDCTATGGRQGPNALPLTSCHLTVRNSILASGSGNSPVGSVSITATFPSWTRSLWRSRPSLPTGLNPIIRSDDYAQLLKTFSLEGLSCCDEAKLDSTKANRAATIAHGNLPFRASRLYICIPPHRRLGPRSCPSALRRNSILAVQNGFNPPFRLDCLTQATSLLPSAVTAKRHAPAGLAGRPFAPHGGHQDPWELISNFSGIPRIPVDFERLLRGVPDRTIFARRRTILSQKNDRGQSDQKHSKMHIRIVSWAGRHFAI